MVDGKMKEVRGKFIVYLGRGRTGKSTHARAVHEAAVMAGRPVTVADCDRTNATLTSFIPTAQRPDRSDDETVTKFIEDLALYAMETRTAVMMDLGGGDGVFPIVAERHKFFTVLPAHGVDIIPMYFAAGGRDDLEILYRMQEIGLRSPKTVIVLNEGLAGSRNAEIDPFEPIIRGKTVTRAMADGARLLRMPTVPIATMNEADGLFIGLHAAAAGQVPLGEDGKPHPAARPLGFWRRIELNEWLVELDKRHKNSKVSEWLP